MSSFSVPSSIFSILFCWSLLLFCVVHSSEQPWIRLSHDNFSSDIHTHPFLLCLATVPWCGESRSLMRELSESLSLDEGLQSLLELRIVYLNLDGSLERFFSKRVRYPTFTFFWHSTPLKYKGKLRLQNILTAIHRAIGLSFWDFPLKKLETAPDLESFMGSTDKAVVLFDFCNYTNKIRKSKHHQVVDKPIVGLSGSRGNSNVGQAKDDRFAKLSNTCMAPEILEDLQPRALNAGEHQTKVLLEQNVVQEDAEVSSESKTKDGHAVHGMFLKDTMKDNNDFNDVVSHKPAGIENDDLHQVVSCDSETEFTSLNAPNLLLGQKSGEERHKKSWFTDSTKSGVLTQVEGCNRTQYRHFATVYQSLIKIARGYILTPELASFAIIEDKSLLSTCGIERMQNHTWFLAQWMPDWPNVPRIYHEKDILESFLFGPKQLVNELSRESFNIPSSFCNNTMPVILFIDKVSSLPEVRRKSWEALAALRSFAREHVRQESFEMHNVVLPSTNQPIRVSKDPSSKDLNLLLDATSFAGNVALKVLVDGNQKLKVDASELDEGLQESEFRKLLLSDDNAIYRIREGKIVGEVNVGSISSSLEGLKYLLSSNIDGSMVLKSSKFGDTGRKELPPVEFMEEQLIAEANDRNAFSFYFADGEDQWKDMVQPALPYPSLVILDSLKGGKFMFPTLNQSIDYTSLKLFFNEIVGKKMQKSYLSEVAPKNPRRRVLPPFVNRDFHEVDGVPRITAERLLQLVAQRSMISAPFLDCTKDMHQFWERTALVLFTTTSCGFCKRMELVFREVHQLLMRHLRSTSKGFFKHSHATFNNNEQKVGNFLETKELEIEGSVPRLFQIDCTLNDCSGFFESVDQEELYPSVILYPAQSKNIPIVFGGRSTVQAILKFIAAEGEAGSSIISFLQEGAQKKSTNPQTEECHLPHSSQSILIDSRSSSSRHVYHFMADSTESTSEFDNDRHQTALKPINYPTVGSVLQATDRLSKASKAFESSKILIVKADGQEGFQGLIFNKPLAWKMLTGLDIEMEPLVNRTVLCYGGPVFLQGEPFLSLSRLKDMDGFAEVIPGVYVGGPAATMRVFQAIKEGRLEAANFWFFLGHAVWGWQQLLNEIEQHWWNLSSYEEGAIHLPIQDWLGGSTISVEDVLQRKL